MNHFIERRLFERFYIHCPGLIVKDNEEIEIEVTNVSAQGMGFRTSKLLEEHEELSIELGVKDVPESPILTGEVVWQNFIDSHTYATGFKLDMRSRLKMLRILDQLKIGPSTEE